MTFLRPKRGLFGLGFLDTQPLPRFEVTKVQDDDTHQRGQSNCTTCLQSKNLPTALTGFDLDLETRAKLIGFKMMEEQGVITEDELEKEISKIGKKMKKG